MNDFVIVGGGIVGLATAFRLRQALPQAKITLIEKERSLGGHQTSHNSGVIHSGIYYKPGSLKAINCVQGYSDLVEFCKTYSVPFELCGKVIVATQEEELPRLQTLYERGVANGLKGLRHLNPQEISEYEPHVKGIKGLFVPQTGIIDYSAVVEKLAEILGKQGVVIQCGSAFKGLKRTGSELVVETDQGSLSTQFFINCGGLQSDRIAKMCGHETGMRIVPFMGEYFVLKDERKYLVKNLVYPVPNPEFPFLGVHFTRGIHGEIDAGPNAVLALSRETYAKFGFNLKDTIDIFTWTGSYHIFRKYWKTGLGELHRSISKKAFVKSLQRLLPEVTGDDLTPYRPGIRAQACTRDGQLIDDFYYFQAEKELHVLNAPSPAATSSLSIGRQIVEKALAQIHQAGRGAMGSVDIKGASAPKEQRI